MKKKTPEEKQFINDLRAVLKKMPKHLCLVTPHYNKALHVMRKECFCTYYGKNPEPVNDAFDSEALLAEIKTDAREDGGYW